MKHINAHLNVALKLAGLILLLALVSLVVVASTTLHHVDEAVMTSQHELYDKGGLVDIAKSTMLHVDRVTGEAAIAARQQRGLSEQVSREVLHTLKDADATVLSVDHSLGMITTDLHASLANVDTAVGSLNSAIQNMGPLLGSGKDVLDQGQRTLVSLNTLLSDPQIQQTIHHVNDMSTNMDQVTADLAGVTHDVRGVVHKKANPTKTQKVEDQILFGLKTSFYLSWLFK